VIATRNTRLVAVAAAILPVVVWVVPSLRARAKAVAVLADATRLPFPRPRPCDVAVSTVENDGAIGDLYSSGNESPVIVFVPGAAPGGRSDSRVVQAAAALARAGRRVFVPELHLYRRTFNYEDVERLVTAIVELSAGAQVGVLGFSYGGSFSLLAAQDERTRNRLAYVATFGAYFDLLHVIQGVTTGSTLLDGSEVNFPTLPEAREILTSATMRLASGEGVTELARGLGLEDASELPTDLEPVQDLLANEDPLRTDELAAKLPPLFRTTLERFSPSTAIERLEAPLFILQSKKDAATPWTEAVLLDRAVERSRLVLLNHFSHVDPPGLLGWFADGSRAWRFLSWLLAAQE
jgi:pimeloyl-ACP methyl ester carboxylesterase